MIIQPANSVRALGELKVNIAEQAHIIRANELRDHIVWLVYIEIAVLGAAHRLQGTF